MTTLQIITQLGIFIFGCSSVWLVGRKEHWRRWGYIAGALGQPFWFLLAWETKAWGLGLLTFWYAYSWGQGVYNYWIRPNATTET